VIFTIKYQFLNSILLKIVGCGSGVVVVVVLTEVEGSGSGDNGGCGGGLYH